MKWSKTIAGLIIAIASFMLWIVSDIPEWEHIDSWVKDIFAEKCYTAIFNHRVTISIVANVLNAGAILILALPQSRKKSIRKIFTVMLNEFFQSDQDQTRITLFVPKRGWQFIVPHFFKAICYFKIHLEKKCFWAHFNINPFKKYLVIKVRHGEPYNHGTTSFFNIPNDKTEVNGYVSWAWYKGNIQTVDNLPKITREDLNAPSQKRGERHTRISEYMKGTYMKKIEKLKALHRFPRHLCAIPILNSEEKIDAFVVVDSIEEKSPFAKESFSVYINSYTRIIQEIWRR